MSIRRLPTIPVTWEAGHSVCHGHNLGSVNMANVWSLVVSPRTPCFSLGNESFPIFKADPSAYEDENKPQLVAWEPESSPSWLLIPTIKSWEDVIFFLSFFLFKRIYRIFWGGEKWCLLTQPALPWSVILRNCLISSLFPMSCKGVLDSDNLDSDLLPRRMFTFLLNRGGWVLDPHELEGGR